MKLLKLFKKHSTSFKEVQVSFFKDLKLNFFFGGKFFLFGGLQGDGWSLEILGEGGAGFGDEDIVGGGIGRGFLLFVRVILYW